PLATESVAEIAPTLNGEIEEVEYLTYKSHGRRDPFLSPGPQPGESPTAYSANLNNLFYRGMISVDGVPTALVEDSAGFGFSLKVGEKIAGGKVVQITAEELIISAPGWGRRSLPVTTAPLPITP
ncbi:pilus assembly protein PilP, partial [bacterium]|nr:pilus assembly protein PilP [bacterium]